MNEPEQITMKQYIDTRIEELDKRTADNFKGVKEAVASALAAKGTDKAEHTGDYAIYIAVGSLILTGVFAIITTGIALYALHVTK